MTVAKLTPTRADDWAEAAQWLRELADRFEAGEIADMVCVINDRERNRFVSYGLFDNLWRLLGAIEYAKATVIGRRQDD